MPFWNDFILNHGIRCSFILGKKKQTLVHDVDRGGACACGEQRTQNSVLPAQFCCELKTALKNTVTFKKGIRD